MIIKVCGMKYAQNIAAIAQLPIDYMGFVFYQRSPRFVDYMDVSRLPSSIKKVGVFVNATAEEIGQKVKRYGLQTIQLHGNESPEMCQALRQALSVEVIKAFCVDDVASLAPTSDYEGACDMFLFDTKTPLHGGSGKQFDWNVLQQYNGTKPFLLSGGIGPCDAAAVKAFKHPAFLGLDLNSRFETLPGLKDMEAVEAFVKNIKGV